MTKNSIKQEDGVTANIISLYPVAILKEMAAVLPDDSRIYKKIVTELQRDPGRYQCAITIAAHHLLIGTKSNQEKNKKHRADGKNRIEKIINLLNTLQKTLPDFDIKAGPHPYSLEAHILEHHCGSKGNAPYEDLNKFSLSLEAEIGRYKEIKKIVNKPKRKGQYPVSEGLEFFVEAMAELYTKTTRRKFTISKWIKEERNDTWEPTRKDYSSLFVCCAVEAVQAYLDKLRKDRFSNSQIYNACDAVRTKIKNSTT